MSETKLSADSFRECFDGAVPGMVATLGADGMPNLAYVSQAQFIDDEHLALSFQFFNTTRRNILAHPYARLMLVDPHTAAQYRLALNYLRTETAGPIFENMKAKLAGIASYTGMSGVFRLQGADIYRILDVERVAGATLPAPQRRNLLAALRHAMARLCDSTDLDQLFSATFDALERHFGIDHAMILLLDNAAGRLYTVASRGYPHSGAGSEIPLGAGAIGIAAAQATPIRIGHFTAEYAYGRAVRDSVAEPGLLENEIPLPGLAQPQSQLAVPIAAGGRVIGVLCVESERHLSFGYDEEDALVALSSQLGLLMQSSPHTAESGDEPADAAAPAAALSGEPVELRHYDENDSIFLGGDYLIKGVAGSILWALVRDYVARGRVEFSNRELRLDPRIRLPDLGDNLEARLLLLTRRLEERNACLRIEKSGRGRFRLRVSRPLSLADGS